MDDAVKRVEEYLDRHDEDQNGDSIDCLIYYASDDRPIETVDLLKKDIRAIVEENKRLRKDKDRLDYLEGECNDLVCVADTIADTGDSDIVWEVVGHFMGKPYNRVLSVSNDMRKAIDKAMNKP